jgi:TonB family protein
MAPHLMPVGFQEAGTLRLQSACKPGQYASDARRPTPDPLYDGTVKIGGPGLIRPGVPLASLPLRGDGADPPVPLKEVKPTYTTDAYRQKVEGMVTVLARVEADGTVAYAEIDCSLDSVHGLDGQALKAAKQWVFRPARLNGRPVAVVVSIELDFRLGTTPPGHEV